MRFTATQSSRSLRSRSLYLVPDRRVPRARHVSVGRALHLVDLENLMCGPLQPAIALRYAAARYEQVAVVRPDDHVVVAVNPALALDAGRAWPTARLLVGRGPDGADRELLATLADTPWVAARYDRVVIGSGDGIFASALESLRALGIATGVVAPELGLSRDLRRRATFVRLITGLATELNVA
jgi:hypothetical protein